jgi:hypothetical protein
MKSLGFFKNRLTSNGQKVYNSAVANQQMIHFVRKGGVDNGSTKEENIEGKEKLQRSSKHEDESTGAINMSSVS